MDINYSIYNTLNKYEVSVKNKIQRFNKVDDKMNQMEMGNFSGKR